jgi:hypothetical protein
MTATAIEINLTAAIVAVERDTPLILATARGRGAAAAETGLPSGPFDPLSHRTFEIGLRAWVIEQTALDIGYVEQLYTFGDRGRHAGPGDAGPHVVSVGYLALTRRPEDGASLAAAGAGFRPWYHFFPWEDWRGGRPEMLDEHLLPRLAAWAAEPGDRRAERRPGRLTRLRLAFGSEALPWDEERVLERYELLYEAGLAPEAVRDRALAEGRDAEEPKALAAGLGEPMISDHRRILATGLSRLRGKIKYRPVVFELMAPEFTLYELQRTVEAIAGIPLHKQNFRRMIERTQLVEGLGRYRVETGGRPAELFRFRRELLSEKPSYGLSLPSLRE